MPDALDQDNSEGCHGPRRIMRTEVNSMQREVSQISSLSSSETKVTQPDVIQPQFHKTEGNN